MHSAILSSFYDTIVADKISTAIVGEEISIDCFSSFLDDFPTYSGVFTANKLIDGWSMLEFFILKFLKKFDAANSIEISTDIVNLLADEFDIGRLSEMRELDDLCAHLEITAICEQDPICYRCVLEFVALVLARWENILEKMYRPDRCREGK